MSGPEFPRPTLTRGRRLGDLAGRLGVSIEGGAAADAVVTGVTHDSRQVRPGDLYAALPGAKAHGSAFAADVARAGAVAILTDDAGLSIARDAGLPVLRVENPRALLGPVASWVHDDPSSRLRIFGVTGTNGKTTTTYLLEAALRAAGETTGLIGTIETRVGEQAVASVRTTPEASDLQTLLAAMVERGVGAVAMEVSSHALALHRVDGVAFDEAGFTNLSQDHLDFHADLEDYFAAKARLFTPPLATRGVVNKDDEHGRRLLAAPRIPLLSISADGDPAADWWASNVEVATGGSRFVAHGPGGLQAPARIVLPGRFNVANALVALAMLADAGVDVELAMQGIAALPGVPGRMERVDVGQPFAVLVDFAHTPEAVSTLLQTARASAPGRVIVVLGCGGDRDASKRPLMGAAAARLSDLAVLTSDNPRSEDPERILQAMVAGASRVPESERAQVVVEPDRSAAIAAALRAAQAGDVVIVAGKGHEQGQEIAGVVHPFDDRAVVRARLAELGWAVAAS